MLYVTPSRLEAFRQVVREDLPWATDEQLVADILNPRPAGWQALYGSALHAAIEAPDQCRQADGSYQFTERDGRKASWPAAIVDEARAAWPTPCLFERPFRVEREIAGQRVLVGGRTDGWHGLVIVEGKTKFGQFDPADFARSLQWQVYLWAHPWATCVEYRVHEIGGMSTDEDTGDVRFVKNGPRLEEIHVWRQWRQAGLDAAVEGWIADFCAWARARGVAHKLAPSRPESLFGEDAA